MSGRPLWAKAPFVLRRHPALLAAVLVTAALAALAAASGTFVRAAVQSQSLRSRVTSMSPLAVGLQIRTAGRLSTDGERRAAAVRLTRRLPFLGKPVLSSLFPLTLAGNEGTGLQAYALTRSGAIAHVEHLSSAGGDGVWIPQSIATTTRLRAGGRLPLATPSFPPRPPVVVRVAGVYRDLDTNLNDPYWANWAQDLRPRAPYLPPPPPFLLLPERTFDRVAHRISPYVENRFEFPVEPASLTFTGARRLERRFAALERALPDGRALGCNIVVAHRVVRCIVTTSLDSALAVAENDMTAASPTISLLADSGLALALGLTLAAGVFLVRRRADEAQLHFARGEAAAAFATRTALEALLPAALGAGAGLGLALLTLRAFSPPGTIDAGTVAAGAERAAAAGGAAVVAVALGAALAFPRRHGAAGRWPARLGRVPWEAAPLAAAGVLLGIVLTGGGLAHDANGNSHPRLLTFALPVLAVAGTAGLAVRVLRRLLRGRADGARAVLFLAVRRLAAARALLVAVVVACGAAFGSFAYAATLSASLERSAAEKAFVANGSDVQGVLDPTERITSPLPFPAVIVQVDQLDVSLPSGKPIDLIAGDPAALRRTIRWEAGFGNDPRALLPRLEHADGAPLPAIGTPDLPSTDAVIDQGVRVPIRIVGRAPFPGASAGRPAVVLPEPALRRFAARHGFQDPASQASGLIWAKGNPARIERVFARSNLAPTFLTTPAHITENPSVGAARRSYRYLKAIGAGAALLSLVALLLYLQARQRGQLVASALARRMGLRGASDAAALALESATVVVVAATIGAAVAVAAARPLVPHVDPLPLYAPAPVFLVPWGTIALGLAGAAIAGAFTGAAAAAAAARGDVAEVLRVA